MSYEFMEHTADVKFIATGKTIEEAFSSAIIATTHVLIDPKKVACVRDKKINIRSKSMESLLYDLFEELIFLIDTELFLTSKVLKISIEGNGPYELTATLEGDSITNYSISGDIKSATYNEMEIKKDSDGCTLQAVLDI